MKYPQKGVIQIAKVANGIMDPILSNRAGINTALLGSWDEIAGKDFADCTRPEKISWSRRDERPDCGSYQTGVLTIACEGARALFITHVKGEMIARINGFFGFPAVRQIRIIQKPVSQAVVRQRKPQPLHGKAAQRLEGMMDGIENEVLRKAITRLGTAVLQKKSGEGTI